MGRYLPLMVAAVLLGILWYGVHQPPKSEDSVSSPKMTSSWGGGTQESTELPEADLPVLDGGENFNLGRLTGQWTMLHVWATWCGACRAEYPLWNTLEENHPEIQKVSLVFQDDPKRVSQWLKEHGNPFKMTLLDQTGQTREALRVRGIPLTLIINPEGKICYRYLGSIHLESFERDIVPIIKGEKS